MKAFLSLFTAFCCCLLHAADPIFYLDFDKTIKPVKGDSGTELRTETQPVFRPGIRGQALLTGTDEQGKRYGLICSRKGNLNWGKGSISFWLQPVNWNGSDSGFFATFFNAGSDQKGFRIYKYYEGDSFFFLRGPFAKWLRSFYRTGEWKQGEWHHIVCTWDNVQQTLYIDGRLISELAIAIPQPDSGEKFFHIGEIKGELLFKGKGRLSLMDEFKIYDTVLDLRSVQALYRQDDPGNLPKQTITLCNSLNAFSSLGLNSMENNELVFENASYTLGRDSKNLYITLKCDELKGQKTFAVFQDPVRKQNLKITLRETVPGKYEAVVPLKELPQLSAGKTMLFNLYCGAYDLNGFMQLSLNDSVPEVHLHEIFDFRKNMYSVRAKRADGTELTIDGDAYTEVGHFHRKGNLNDGDYFTKHPLGPWQIVTIRFKKAGAELYRVNYNVRLKTPLTIQYMYTLLKTRELLASFQGRKKGTLLADFISGQKTVKTFSREVSGEAGFFKVKYPVQEFKPGNYTVCFRFKDEKGNMSVIARQPYRIAGENDPLIRPYEDPEKDKVPQGFHPVRAEGNKVHLSERSVDLSDGLLFRSLVSKGKDLLNQPDALIFNGKRVVPSNIMIKQISATPLAAEYEKTAGYPEFSIRSRIKINFDGYMQIRMSICPKKELTIRSLSYEMPFGTERIRLFRPPEAVTPLAGTVGDKLEYSFTGNAVFWIGDYYRGINFTAENLTNWTFRPAHPQLTVIREKRTAFMRLNLMSVPKTISGEYPFVFGLTLTPVKAIDQKILRTREGIDYQSWYQPWKWFNRLDPVDVTPYGIELFEGMKAKKMPFFYYSAYNFCSPCSPEMTWYDERWRQLAHGHNHGEYIGKWNQPEYVYSEACICCSEYRNYLLNNMQRFLSAKKNLIATDAPKNIYFDAMWEESCENANHGCTQWTDFNGRKRKHILIDSYRELAIDIWRMIKRQGGMVRIHMEWPKILQCHAYADILTGGEIQEAAVAKQEGYYDVMTPAAFYASFSPYIHSAKTVFTQQIYRGLQTTAPAKLQDYDPMKAKWKRATIHSIGLAAVHDADITMFDGTNPWLALYRKTQDRLVWDQKVRFFPYFAEDPAIRLNPVSERIVGSVYEREGKLMLCLLNDTDQKIPVEISLDFKKLGVSGKVFGTDIYNGTSKIPLQEKMTFKLNPREFRLLFFEPQK